MAAAPPPPIAVITPVILQFREQWDINTKRLRQAKSHAVGDQARLSTVYAQGVQFLQVTESIRHLLPEDEVGLAEIMVDNLLEDVENAASGSDSSIAAFITPVQLLPTGGRPYIDIDPRYLEEAIQLGSIQRTADAIGVSRWTVRRRLVELGIVEGDPPVITTHIGPDGEEILRYHQPVVPTCNWTDNELDARVEEALTLYPDLGRPMLLAYFRDEGFRIPEERMERSLRRVRPRVFGARAVNERRTYHVAGPNALWHMDAQLGLVRYGFVIHGIIDGYSRCMTGIRVNDNNTKASFFELFQQARLEHGTPSRMRGDHGVENLDVAEWMIAHRGGVERGSFIWGKSVHNIRIERLWVDITNGFGRKWKRFFKNLEIHLGLVVIDPGHQWLLLHLFLPDVDRDAQRWCRIWNCHKVILPGGQRKQSPNELWFFGSIEHGVRGVNDDIWYREHEELYGVDWQELEDDDLIDHHMGRPVGVPVQGDERIMSEVRVDPAGCPLTARELALLDEGLEGYYGSDDMLDRGARWQRALSLYNDILHGFVA